MEHVVMGTLLLGPCLLLHCPWLMMLLNGDGGRNAMNSPSRSWNIIKMLKRFKSCKTERSRWWKLQGNTYKLKTTPALTGSYTTLTRTVHQRGLVRAGSPLAFGYFWKHGSLCCSTIRPQTLCMETEEKLSSLLRVWDAIRPSKLFNIINHNKKLKGF